MTISHSMIPSAVAINLDIQPGERFRYVPLGHPTEDADRTIVILGTSVGGEISYRIDMDEKDEFSEKFGPTIGGVPIERVPWLLANGIWDPIKIEA